MFKNYLKIAFRNLWRNKGFSAINIIGLAIGIATCLIILLFVKNELSYDRFNKKADRIVRISFQGNVQGQKMNEANVMPPVAQTMKAGFPGVEEATRIRDAGTPTLECNYKTFREEAFAYVDSNFFRVFTLPLLQGDPQTALVEPNSVVISKATAWKYFGTENAMGKVIHFKERNQQALKVTGVMNDIPLNSHFHFELFGSMSSLPESREINWLNSNFYTYLLLAKGTDYKVLESKLPLLVDKYMGPQMLPAMGMSLETFRKNGNSLSFHLQPLTAIHLHADFDSDLSRPGDARNVYIFGAIALFMLLIACINFMNLSTAGASRRSREVGIRKVLGSLKRELVWQFLLESILLTIISMLLAIGFIYLALPFFNNLSNQHLSIDIAASPWMIPGVCIFILLVGILAGSYPAFYLSSFKPVAVLKGKCSPGKSTISLRSILVVFQFCISIILIVSTLVVYKQLSYMQHKKLGYNKDEVLIISNTWMLGKNQDAFRKALQKDSRIASISSSRYLPAGVSDNNNFFVTPGEGSTQLIKTLRYDVDEQYIPTLGIKMIEGRNFSTVFGNDSANIIINEAAAHAFGWGESAIGKSISRTNNNGEVKTFHVIGMVQDFHFRSLHELISPLLMVLAPDPGNLVVKLKTSGTRGLISSINKHWTAFGGEGAPGYSFLDERYFNTYKPEQKTGMIIGIFAALTIFVACLGLFGLAKFTAERRTKEIGIRKVLGSSVAGIARLLSIEFLKLVSIAFIVAVPIAWFMMHQWLLDFAYRIQLNGWIFVVTAVLIIIITLSTISFQAIKSAMVNPVKSLRSE